MDSETREVNSASFNDAIGQAVRLNELAKRLIDSKLSPYIINIRFGVVNYSLRLSTLESLWSEIRPKCTPQERIFIEKIKDVLDEALIKYPPMTYINETKQNFNEQNWNIINILLTRWEEQIKELQDEHGLGNPSKEMDEGL